MQNARTIGLEALKRHVDRPSIRQAVRKAIIAHARGETVSPMPGELVFDDPHGDCHIKFGRIVGGPRFIVKVIAGFYDNPKIGLPVNSGAVMVLSARTGAFEAIIFDEGWLTSWRTAAAGSLASARHGQKRMPDNRNHRIGAPGRIAGDLACRYFPRCPFRHRCA
ncbi:hypothetical protein LP421_34095 (plasmid) [Rhizobium sp. RCAM05350]|uniref:hypothetical protein n=1 Tax=Rhizobium sp. RCAM05350 TaxID=2895568 RepID=UPI0020768FD9|nr:hypothetical protein [Rhizobium sp. RCAM05350]URK89428.1 hypothetical protein LP421_34095 [Rhizobium sp. RCAM05350]